MSLGLALLLPSVMCCTPKIKVFCCYANDRDYDDVGDYSGDEKAMVGYGWLWLVMVG